MDIYSNINNTNLSLKLVGRLDSNTSKELENVINDIKDITKLILDFKELDYVSSAGLRVLLAAQKKMNILGSLEVINVKDEVYEVLDMTGFTSILNIIK